MGQGTRYRHIERIIGKLYKGGKVLEIGAGGAVYADLFDDYVATDLPGTPYKDEGDIDIYCDGRCLPFRRGSFDMVFTVATLYAIPDPEMVCQEVWLCLKEGGVFVVFDYTEGTKVKALINNLRRGNKRAFNFWLRRDFDRLLYRSGFTNRRQFHRSFLEGCLYRLASWIGDKKCHWLIYKGEKSG